MNRLKCIKAFNFGKKKSGTPLFKGIPELTKRCLADSNRRGRFCRP